MENDKKEPVKAEQAPQVSEKGWSGGGLGGATATIGGTITGGNAGDILYINPQEVLDQDSLFTWDVLSKTLQLGDAATKEGNISLGDGAVSANAIMLGGADASLALYKTDVAVPGITLTGSSGTIDLGFFKTIGGLGHAGVDGLLKIWNSAVPNSLAMNFDGATATALIGDDTTIAGVLNIGDGAALATRISIKAADTVFGDPLPTLSIFAPNGTDYRINITGGNADNGGAVNVYSADGITGHYAPNGLDITTNADSSEVVLDMTSFYWADSGGISTIEMTSATRTIITYVDGTPSITIDGINSSIQLGDAAAIPGKISIGDGVSASDMIQIDGTPSAPAAIAVKGTGVITLGINQLTPGTMVVQNSGVVGNAVASFTWSNADIAALGDFLVGDITICTLKAKMVVKNVYVIITGQAAGTTTLTVSVGRTGTDYIDYIVASNAKAVANTVYGSVSEDRGTQLTGYDLPSYTGTTDIVAHFTSTVENLSAVTGSAGTIVIEIETLL